MGCAYCVYMGKEDDGSDYPSNSYSICNAEMPVANLKGFPFKKVPKSCKKIFSIDFWHFSSSERVFLLEEVLCNNLCRKAGLCYEQKQCCQDCEAFNFLVEKTDINLRNYPEEQIIDLLKKMKFKQPFEFAVYQICSDCNGEGYMNRNEHKSYSCDICHKCDGKGRIQTNLPIIKNKVTTITCKICGESRTTNRFHIEKRNGKHMLNCYSCKKEYEIKNFKFITKSIINCNKHS